MKISNKMDAPKLIMHTLNSVDVNSSLDKDKKKAVNDHLKFLSNIVDSETEKKNLSTVIKIFNKGRLNKDDKEIIIKSIPRIENIITKYVEEFNVEPNTNVIDKTLSVKEVEELLDGKIKKYSFNENHPMDHVSYHKRDKIYQVSIDKKYNIERLEEACNLAKEFITEKSDADHRDFLGKKKFDYKGHYFVTYWIDNKLYFDIQHIISVLNLKNTHRNEKYNEFSDYIKFYSWHQNTFGGYILRELIDEEGMYQIILSSNSVLSKSFKKNVSKILVMLRQSGGLVIVDDELEFQPITEPHSNKLAFHVKDIQYNHLFSYTNHVDVREIHSYIDYASHINIIKYVNTPVMYMFVVTLDIPTTYILVKIGYTENISARIKSLKSEFKSNFFLLNLKRVTSRSAEEQFHREIKSVYPEFVQKYVIKTKQKSTDKDEIYKFSNKLYSEFDSIINIKRSGTKYTEESSKHQDDINFLNEQSMSFFELSRNKSMLFDFLINPNNNQNEHYTNKYFGYLHNCNDNQFKMEQLKIMKELELARIESNERISVREYNKAAKDRSIERERMMLEREKMELEKYKLQFIDKEIKLAKYKNPNYAAIDIDDDTDAKNNVMCESRKHINRPIVKLM